MLYSTECLLNGLVKEIKTESTFYTIKKEALNDEASTNEDHGTKTS